MAVCGSVMEFVVHTGQCAVKRLLSSVAPHVCAQCVCTGVRLTFTGAVGPLARVPFLSAADMLVVDVLHQSVHVAQVAGIATIPATYSDLIITLTVVFVILIVTQHTDQAG